MPECPQTRFPDGTHCGEYGWHASDCPARGPEICVHCKERLLQKGTVVAGEWAHWHGDSYCHDRNGFCATPLRKAQPTYHGAGDVL